MTQESVIEQLLATIRDQERTIHEQRIEIQVLIDENEILYEQLHGQ